LREFVDGSLPRVGSASSPEGIRPKVNVQNPALVPNCPRCGHHCHWCLGFSARWPVDYYGRRLGGPECQNRNRNEQVCKCCETYMNAEIAFNPAKLVEAVLNKSRISVEETRRVLKPDEARMKAAS
jgi:hypothetical protein